jgi:hypothetical protein
MSGFVGAQHEFHDAAFVQGWADRFVPTPPRITLFDLILERVSAPCLPNAHVLELGLGPGYMARHILDRASCFGSAQHLEPTTEAVIARRRYWLHVMPRSANALC